MNPPAPTLLNPPPERIELPCARRPISDFPPIESFRGILKDKGPVIRDNGQEFASVEEWKKHRNDPNP